MHTTVTVDALLLSQIPEMKDIAHYLCHQHELSVF